MMERLFGLRALGLRVQLLLLVVLAVITPILLFINVAFQQREQGFSRAQLTALSLVRQARHEQGDHIEAYRLLLRGLAQQASIRRMDGNARCRETLNNALQDNPRLLNLGVSTRGGKLVCSARPLVGKANLGKQDFVLQAMQKRSYSVSTTQTDRLAEAPVISLGYPVTRDSGPARGVVFALLDLAWLSAILTESKLDFVQEATILLFDQDATIVRRLSMDSGESGRPLSATVPREFIGKAMEEGVVRSQDPDGIHRLYALAPFQQGINGTVYAGVGIPLSPAIAMVQKNFLINIVFMITAGGFVLLAAWWLGYIFIGNTIHSVTEAARRLAKGDLNARTGVRDKKGELGTLAGDFDRMAAVLQKNTRALSLLSAANRTLVRAESESDLLDRMCKTIVNIGGYDCAWVGYLQKNTEDVIETAEQYGFEGGLDALKISFGNAVKSSNSPALVPAIKAVSNGSLQVVKPLSNRSDSWAGEMQNRGYQAVCVLPLITGTMTIGVLEICSCKNDTFSPDELEMLKELAGDLAYGIDIHRIRVAHDIASISLRHAAYYDDLTELANHTLFHQMSRDAIKSALPNQIFAFLIIDIHQFREINDAFGFKHGDAMMKEVAERLRRSVPEDAILARMRSDEFAVLFETRNAEWALKATSDISDSMDRPFVCDTVEVDMKLDIGIALYPDHGKDVATLLRHADIALWQAREKYRNVAVYVGAEEGEGLGRLILARELRQAIEENELVLHFQPKVELASGRLVGVEALVRWHHPEHGLIFPDKFISLAEQTGLIRPLTYWVLEQAAQEALKMRTAGIGIPVAINLSARNLYDEELIERVEDLLRSLHIEEGCLEMEVTESAMMVQPEHAINTIHHLKKYGIPFYIDDFGTGYSSLAYLKRLSADSLKIDRSFVSDMIEDDGSLSIVRSTIDLAHDLGLTVVAEGVESQAMWDRLLDLGCDIAQGYLISKPLPIDQYYEWTRNRANGGE